MIEAEQRKMAKTRRTGVDQAYQKRKTISDKSEKRRAGWSKQIILEK